MDALVRLKGVTAMILKKIIGLLCLDEYITIKDVLSYPLYMGKLADLPFETWIKIKNLEVFSVTANKTGLDIIVY